MNIFDEIRNKTYNFDTTNEDIKKYVQLDYEDLIDLRNRISNDITYPNHDEIFEEDHLTLDHVLDYLEVFIDILKGDK